MTLNIGRIKNDKIDEINFSFKIINPFLIFRFQLKMAERDSLTDILDSLKTDLNFEDYERDVMKPVKVFTGLWIKKCKAIVGAFNFWYKLPDDQLKIAEEYFLGLNVSIKM